MIHPRECYGCGRNAVQFGQFIEGSSGERAKSVPLCLACINDQRAMIDDSINEQREVSA